MARRVTSDQDFGARLVAPLRNYDLFVFDLDGVIYRGAQVVEGAKETLDALRRCGKLVAFNTNNSTRTRRNYVSLLAHFGIETRELEVFTSAYLACLRLRELKPGATVFVVGERGFVEELRSAGFRVANDDPDLKDSLAPSPQGGRFPSATPVVDFVVAGLDRKFDYDKLRLASWAIMAGAQFFASNEDPTLPVPGGFDPGAGAMVAAISTVVGRRPAEVLGKPNPAGLTALARQFSVTPDRCVMVGDRLATDVVAGNRAGFFTVLSCETGANDAEDARNAPDDEHRPDLLLPSVAHFFE